MENLRSIYGDEEEEEEEETSNNDNGEPVSQSQPTIISTLETTKTPPILTENNDSSSLKQQSKEEAEISEEISEIELSEDDNDELPTHKQLPSEKFTTTVSDDDEEEEEEEEVEAEGEGDGEGEGEEEQEEEEEEGDEVEDENSPRKKQKSLASFTPFGSPPKIIPSGEEVEMEEVEESKKSVEKIPPTAKILKKPKKKTNKANSVWTKSTSRKGKKKNKSNNTNGNHNNNNNYHNVDAVAEESVLITPIHRFPDKNDDSPDMKICLSKVYKAEKVELSDDRFSAGSSKGYRMVRATRGVVEGAWYFEIRVLKLGETGHTRLGWSTEKGDLQAPVGYDGNSFGYRDVDGSKVHKAVREKYGEEGYVEGDVIGCYINLPEGNLYAPNPTQLFWFKGQKYSSKLEAKEESPQVVPGSEICFFRNGIFQGVAFKDLCGGRYYPAASMYTLPNQPNCVVKFNFGPDFEFLPQDFGDRPKPTPMVEVPYQGFDGRPENGESLEKKQ